MNGAQRADNGHLDEDRTGAAAGGGLRVVGKVLAGLVIAASFAVWGYAYSGLADRDTPDLLDEQAFATSAETICAATVAELDELPGALDAVDGRDRAQQLRTSTARYEEMLTGLDREVAGTDRDVEITRAWLADWRVLIGDRYRYADEIEVDENAQFLVTDTGVGERLERRVTRFANTNSMPSCIAPTDVG
ncbi:MAG: hypothetical protein ACR2QO_08875 [Acidimicrobiales bacterium]